MHGIKHVIQPFVLFTAFTVVGQCQPESKQRPNLFEYRKVTEQIGKQGFVIKKVERIHHQYRMIFIIRRKKHCGQT